MDESDAKEQEIEHGIDSTRDPSKASTLPGKIDKAR
jgi:hypothetical protein